MSSCTGALQLLVHWPVAANHPSRKSILWLTARSYIIKSSAAHLVLPIWDYSLWLNALLHPFLWFVVITAWIGCAVAQINAAIAASWFILSRCNIPNVGGSVMSEFGTHVNTTCFSSSSGAPSEEWILLCRLDREVSNVADALYELSKLAERDSWPSIYISDHRGEGVALRGVRTTGYLE